jgi:hypothetical protein
VQPLSSAAQQSAAIAASAAFAARREGSVGRSFMLSARYPRGRPSDPDGSAIADRLRHGYNANDRSVTYRRFTRQFLAAQSFFSTPPNVRECTGAVPPQTRAKVKEQYKWNLD